MQYMTIVLELLKEHQELHEQLRLTRRLLPTLETCAKELRESHFAWTEHLMQASPDSDPMQIASEALEMALHELENRLPSAFPPEGDDPLSLDQAMAFVLHPTPVK
jgi:hypothetical protein